MLPLRLQERDHPDFDGPIVEIWRENEFVGYVFWDEDVAVVQVYTDDAGEPFDLDANELVRVIDIAQRIVTPDSLQGDAELESLPERLRERGAEPEEAWEDEDYRILQLADEFDDLAVHRDQDGEGFFGREDAEALIARCEQLGLAVVELEGLEWNGRALIPREDLHLRIDAEPEASWEAFRPQANATAAARLEAWPTSGTLVVSFVVQLPDGETRVL